MYLGAAENRIAERRRCLLSVEVHAGDEGASRHGELLSIVVVVLLQFLVVGRRVAAYISQGALRHLPLGTDKGRVQLLRPLERQVAVDELVEGRGLEQPRYQARRFSVQRLLNLRRKVDRPVKLVRFYLLVAHRCNNRVLHVQLAALGEGHLGVLAQLGQTLLDHGVLFGGEGVCLDLVADLLEGSRARGQVLFNTHNVELLTHRDDLCQPAALQTERRLRRLRGQCGASHRLRVGAALARAQRPVTLCPLGGKLVRQLAKVVPGDGAVIDLGRRCLVADDDGTGADALLALVSVPVDFIKGLHLFVGDGHVFSQRFLELFDL